MKVYMDSDGGTFALQLIGDPATQQAVTGRLTTDIPMCEVCGDDVGAVQAGGFLPYTYSPEPGISCCLPCTFKPGIGLTVIPTPAADYQRP